MTFGIIFRLVLVGVFLINLPISEVEGQSGRKKTITRVFWQDRETQRLSYADLSTTDRWHIKRGWVQNFPKIDPATESLGPMLQIGKQLAVAINQENESNVIRISSGVTEVPHGNHFHWTYANQPKVDFRVPAKIAATGALAVGKDFFFYGKQDGVLRINSEASPNVSKPPVIYRGGRENISLAVSNKMTAFACCGAATGDNAGNVDVIQIRGNANPVSIDLNCQGVTAAVEANGRLFVAHDQGISWVPVMQGVQNVAPVELSNSSANEIGRPDMFVREQNWILFAINNQDYQGLGLIDSSSPAPRVVKLPIPTASGMSLTTPRTKLSLGKRFVFLFQENVTASDGAQENLVVVELDPNRDSNFSDAVVRATIPVGASKIEGDGGHHDICFDDYGRFAIFSEPGEGMLNVMTLNDLKLRARFRVQGTPDRIVAVGSPEHFH